MTSDKPKRKKFRLKNIAVRRIDMVDRGANQESHIVFTKGSRQAGSTVRGTSRIIGAPPPPKSDVTRDRDGAMKVTGELAEQIRELLAGGFKVPKASETARQREQDAAASRRRRDRPESKESDQTPGTVRRGRRPVGKSGDVFDLFTKGLQAVDVFRDEIDGSDLRDVLPTEIVDQIEKSTTTPNQGGNPMSYYYKQDDDDEFDFGGMSADDILAAVEKLAQEEADEFGVTFEEAMSDIWQRNPDAYDAYTRAPKGSRTQQRVAKSVTPAAPETVRQFIHRSLEARAELMSLEREWFNKSREEAFDYLIEHDPDGAAAYEASVRHPMSVDPIDQVRGEIRKTDDPLGDVLNQCAYWLRP